MFEPVGTPIVSNGILSLMCEAEDNVKRVQDIAIILIIRVFFMDQEEFILFYLISIC